ncbi:hypothetical protein N9W79_01800 [bacterium]|nr:hypothetical protein [bacterium]
MLLLFSCSEVPVESLRDQNLKASSKEAVGSEEFDESEIALPSNVSGSFLVCANISSTKKNAEISCSVTSNRSEGILSFEEKETKKSKDFIHSNFEFDVLPPPSVGSYEIIKEKEGSAFDFRVSVDSNSTALASKYLNETTIVLSYIGNPKEGIEASDKALLVNSSENRLLGQIKVPLSDLLEGVKNEIVFTKTELKIPASKYIYTIPGKVLPDFSVEKIEQIQGGGLTHDAHSLTVVGDEFWYFGVWNENFTWVAGDVNYAQPAGTANSAVIIFDKDQNYKEKIIFPPTLITEGAVGSSAYYSSKVDSNGIVYAVGKQGIKGLVYQDDDGNDITVTEDFGNASILAIDPKKRNEPHFKAVFGQPWTHEVLYGVDAKDTRFIGVGLTEGRYDTNNKRAGYVGIVDFLDFEKQEVDFFHHYFFTSSGDIAFNDVSIIDKDSYTISGLVKGNNCSKSKGMIATLNTIIGKDTEGVQKTEVGNIEYNFYGTENHNVYFSQIIMREDGSYSVRATVEFSNNDEQNKDLGITGEKEVTIYFDKNLEMLTAFLDDGRKVKLSKFEKIECPATI